MHVLKQKQKLLARVKRIRGQLEGIERAIETDTECDDVLHRLAGVRGALGGLMAEVVEDHVRHHLIDTGARNHTVNPDAVERLLEVVRTYVR